MSIQVLGNAVEEPERVADDEKQVEHQRFSRTTTHCVANQDERHNQQG
jgi:hypothetical protein